MGDNGRSAALLRVPRMSRLVHTGYVSCSAGPHTRVQCEYTTANSVYGAHEGNARSTKNLTLKYRRSFTGTIYPSLVPHPMRTGSTTVPRLQCVQCSIALQQLNTFAYPLTSGYSEAGSTLEVNRTYRTLAEASGSCGPGKTTRPQGKLVRFDVCGGKGGGLCRRGEGVGPTKGTPVLGTGSG